MPDPVMVADTVREYLLSAYRPGDILDGTGNVLNPRVYRICLPVAKTPSIQGKKSMFVEVYAVPAES